MWTQLQPLLLWLHQPDHVARFQRYFGILPIQPQAATKKAAPSNGYHRRNHQRKVTYDANVIDECLEEMKQSQDDNIKASEKEYEITRWFWYYFFLFGSALGNEIFYIVFFPTWVWNVDGCVARKVAMLWAFFMYVGQATKDILQMPRPAPPAIQLEKRYIEEFGFPSTHAMFAAGIPLSLLFLSHQRYDFNIWIGLIFAAVFCLWVCFSRIYLGMHTFLDIVGGIGYALLLICIAIPYVNEIDDLLLNFALSPLINFCLGIFLIKCYPSVKLWSTARSDTTVILGSTIGHYSSATIMNQLGLLERPASPPIYSIIPPDFGLWVLRTLIGLVLVFITRQIVKTVVLRLTCLYYRLDSRNPQIKRLAQVEMPYYYLTYFSVGFNVGFLCPLAFRAMGINRDYSFTEL